MIRPNRKPILTPADQARIANVLGSKTEPAEADVVGQYARHKSKPPALQRFRCGHPADLSQMDCPTCRAKNYAAKSARNQGRRDAKKDADPFRFPAGTLTSETWDGDCWFGTVYIPNGKDQYDRLMVMPEEKITGKEKLGRRFRELYEAWVSQQK